MAAGASVLVHARNGQVAPAWQTIAVGSLARLVALLLLVGFLTPIAGSLGVAVGLVSFAAPDLCLSAIAAAIVLLGPGAYSVDARLFGRREIRF
jgi:uncharacterized membrane protein YphA (DoxX/SURF4 family)